MSLSFDIEEIRYTQALVQEFTYATPDMAHQLVLDLAISRRFAHDHDDASFVEIARKIIKRRIALHQARAFKGISNTIH